MAKIGDKAPPEKQERCLYENFMWGKIKWMEKDNLTLFPSPRQNDMIQIASIALLKAASLLP
ncbi:MAG: hypothetical protein KBG09_04785 [Syntrophobacterales bacterium]|nr:hypothetical protein [Syntrophobacterales bacterium]